MSVLAKLIILVLCCSLIPATLVGVGFYITAERAEAAEVDQRLGRYAAAIERRVGAVLAGASDPSDVLRLWRTLRAEVEGSSMRIRVIDDRRHILFDSRTFPAAPDSALPVAAVDGLLDHRIGALGYTDEAGVAVVAAHRFDPSLGFGALVELPESDAWSVGRDLRRLALGGSIATVSLIAGLACLLAVFLTRPLRALVREAEAATSGDDSRRLPVVDSDELGRLTIAFNRLLDALEKSRSQLARNSTVDELTGLYNRRLLARLAEVEINRARRSGRPLSVLMIDLDRFRNFNERFGTAQGDAFLRDVAAFLKTWLRATDLLARHGGTEFAVLLPETDRETATEIAERLRARFADTQLPDECGEIPVTLSIGIASWSGGARVPASLVESAGRALTQAKQAGRNRVSVAA